MSRWLVISRKKHTKKQDTAARAIYTGSHNVTTEISWQTLPTYFMFEMQNNALLKLWVITAIKTYVII